MYYRSILCQRSLGRAFVFNKMLSPGTTKRHGEIVEKKKSTGEKRPGGFFGVPFVFNLLLVESFCAIFDVVHR